MSAQPKARTDVLEALLDGETVLYDPASESLHHLDVIASTVWMLLDGTGTVDEIVRDLAEAFNAPVDRVAQDVQAMLTSLGDAGLLA